MDRSILHVDIPAFPIAVERVVDPGLVKRPIVVAPPGSARALVLAASSEAVREGVRAGMPLPAARRLCPGVVVLPVNEPLYRRAAGALWALLGGYSPLVEPEGFGRSYVDLTGTGRLFGNAPDVAARIRREVAGRLRLRPTVGVATNKLVSRVAARVIRPDGLCDVFPGGEAPFLAPLPVTLLPGAGSAGPRGQLADLGIARVGDLLGLTPAQMRLAFGRHAERLRRQAAGIDESPVRPPETAPSVVEEETLAEDSNEQAALLRALFALCERAGARLRRMRAVPARLRVTLRHADAVTVRGEGPLKAPTAADLPLFAAARGLLERALVRRVRVRHLELRCFDFVRAARQLSLFGPADFDGAAPRRIGAAETLATAVDRIRGRFGERAIVWGRMLPARAAGAAPGHAAARDPGAPPAGGPP